MWHIFECTYIASNKYNRMQVIDWIWTGAQDISTSDIGHFWRVRGYDITEASYKEVEKQSQENAIITILE